VVGGRSCGAPSREGRGGPAARCCCPPAAEEILQDAKGPVSRRRAAAAAAAVQRSLPRGRPRTCSSGWGGPSAGGEPCEEAPTDEGSAAAPARRIGRAARRPRQPGLAVPDCGTAQPPLRPQRAGGSQAGATPLADSSPPKRSPLQRRAAAVRSARSSSSAQAGLPLPSRSGRRSEALRHRLRRCDGRERGRHEPVAVAAARPRTLALSAFEVGSGLLGPDLFLRPFYYTKNSSSSPKMSSSSAQFVDNQLGDFLDSKKRHRGAIM